MISIWQLLMRWTLFVIYLFSILILIVFSDYINELVIVICYIDSVIVICYIDSLLFLFI